MCKTIKKIALLIAVFILIVFAVFVLNQILMPMHFLIRAAG